MSEADRDSAVAAPAGGARVAVAMSVPVAESGWLWLPLSLAVMIADRAVKLWITHHLAPAQRIRVLPTLDIILTYNTGAAFSFLADASGWQRWLFVLLALAVSAALIVWMRRLDARLHGLLACGLALIVGGALGNMIDRLTTGRVVDFIHVHWGTHYFPAFNIADSAITIGAVLLLLDAWRESRTTKRLKV
jgi:signal peptidase II